MVTVQVFYQSSGNPASGIPVTIIFDGFFGGHTDGDTNSNGEVHFNVDPGRCTVYADHKEVFKGYLEGRRVVYI